MAHYHYTNVHSKWTGPILTAWEWDPAEPKAVEDKLIPHLTCPFCEKS